MRTLIFFDFSTERQKSPRLSPSRKQRLGLGDQLLVGVVLEFDGLARALGGADPAPVTLRRVDDGVGVFVEAWNAVWAGAHTGEASGAAAGRHLGHDAAHQQGILGQQGHGPRGGGLGLGDGLLDGFGIVGQAGQENAFRGEVHRPQLGVRFDQKAFGVDRYLEFFKERPVVVGYDAGGQHVASMVAP